MKIKNSLQALVMLALLFIALLLPAYAIATESQQEKQLELLSEALEAKRQELHIPGMAIAIVKDNEIIMTKGFGLRDIEQKLPVTTDTLFAIGSTSKAFTATMTAMLTENNKLDWDDEVSQYLPDYQFKHDNKAVPITFRDMLSHRTGYSRNDLLWANGKASRKTILKTAAKAEPWDEFRQNFHYNNVMYLAVGEALAAVTSTPWDRLLQTMLLNPLGMSNTSSIHEKMSENLPISLGYQWNESIDDYDKLPRRNLNNVAPAGGLISNVTDMAKWLKFQLNQGTINGQTLIKSKFLRPTHQPQIKINQQRSYGMGWFLHQWQGQPVVEHGGSIDGYAAQVAMLPESKLGFVLLMNVTATPLQQASMNIVWEHILAPDESHNITTSERFDYKEYTGQYKANFASFKNDTFTFLIKDNGKPAVDVPGQTVYELKDPDDNGKWYFAMTDSIAVSFERNTEGDIVTMRMHQGGMDFELPRVGSKIIAEIPTEQLQAFIGQYQSNVFNGPVHTLIQNQRLAINIPNQMVFELHPPDANGFRQFRIKSDMSAQFEANHQGQVTKLVLYRDREKIIESMARVDSQKVSQLPSVDEILTLRNTSQNLKALDEQYGFKLNGQIHVKNSGITGHIQTWVDGQTRFKQHLDFGEFGTITTVANKNSAATYGITPYRNLRGKYLQQIHNDHPAALIDWRNHFDSITVMGEQTHDNQAVYVVKLQDNGLPAIKLFVDKHTGDILLSKTKLLNPLVGGIPVQIEYSDFREVEGVRFPFISTITNPMMGQTVIEYKAVETQQQFAPTVFQTQSPDKP
ncbi:MAG: beta-lactamase family protein [Proteobacteria bacterium]|nr:beta-lactamase family protein [Pseudomonadota bacterium]